MVHKFSKLSNWFVKYCFKYKYKTMKQDLHHYLTGTMYCAMYKCYMYFNMAEVAYTLYKIKLKQFD